MFSCNGDWGLLTLPESLSPPTDLSALTKILLELTSVGKTWTSVQEAATRWHKYVGSSNYAVCLELCCKTWLETQKVRLHTHCAFEFKDRMSLSPSALKTRMFWAARSS